MDPAAEAEALLRSMEQAAAPAEVQPAVGHDGQAANGGPAAAAAQWGEEQLQQWGAAEVKHEAEVKQEPAQHHDAEEPVQRWGATEVKEEVKEEVKPEAAEAVGDGQPLEQQQQQHPEAEQPRRGR